MLTQASWRVVQEGMTIRRHEYLCMRGVNPQNGRGNFDAKWQISSHSNLSSPRLAVKTRLGYRPPYCRRFIITHSLFIQTDGELLLWEVSGEEWENRCRSDKNQRSETRFTFSSVRHVRRRPQRHDGEIWLSRGP